MAGVDDESRRSRRTAGTRSRGTNGEGQRAADGDPRHTADGERPRGTEPPGTDLREPDLRGPAEANPEAGAADPDERGDAARRRRRAQFLRELTEARELRDRVQPRRAKAARLRHAMRMRTFRW
ncbi:hypothetical protein [Streptomyces sp. HM190]|uniref:hypothetical protein n=1 Tax=Streptomyces sp. HM190 TaxID=2695266 RepID=UPI003FA7477C